MRLAIVGAGAVGLGTACVAVLRGHQPVLWSPGLGAMAGPQTIQSRGSVEGAFAVQVAPTPAAAADRADAAILCLPGWGHKDAYDALAGFAKPVIVSAHLSLGAVYAGRLGSRPVVAWGTTLVTGRRSGPLACTISNVRTRIDAASLPASATGEGIALCTELFGDRFQPRANVLAIQLSNVNPQNHMAMLLCNLTRVDRGEDWGNYWGISPAVGVLMEALDQERLAIAAAFGVGVRTVHDHFALSFGVPMASMGEMAASVHAAGNAPLGPKSLDGRYVEEDVPYGLAVTEALGRMAEVPTPLHTAGVALFSAIRQRDYRTVNGLLDALSLDGVSKAALAAQVA